MSIEKSSKPPINHLGFIVDGNRRWAKARELPTLEGHRKGLKKVQLMIEQVAKAGIPFTSFFLFSTENWGRSAQEVEYLMSLARTMIKSFRAQAKKHQLRIKIMGRDEPAPKDLLAKLHQLEQETSQYQGPTICLCFNYGGQQEIVDATNQIVREHPKDGPLTIETFAQYLYQPLVPPLDLVVRTSGEQRTSGFMLWRAAYAELMFLPKFFPDITAEDFADILTEYQRRSRRFGH